jgi:hypothetical protein
MSFERRQLTVLGAIVALAGPACSSGTVVDVGTRHGDAAAGTDASGGLGDAAPGVDAEMGVDAAPIDGAPDASAPDSATMDAAAADAAGADAANCNPVAPTSGCNPGDTCYFTPMMASLVVHCEPTPATALYDQASCDINAPACRDGSSCFSIRGRDFEPRCHHMCHQLGDCMTFTSSGTPNCEQIAGTGFGVCIYPFLCNPTADKCPTGQSCAPLAVGVFGCVPQGASPGQDCRQTHTCTKGYVCTGDANMATCNQACDMTHACTMGSCQSQAGFPNGFGICF